MLKRLLDSLQKKAASGAPPPVPEDPRALQGRAEYAACQSQYARLHGPALQPGASAQTLLDFAQACFVLERDAECKDALERALALAPDSPLAHYSMALLVSGDAHFAQAETHLRQALARAPTDRNVRLALAMTLLGRNQYPEGYRLLRARMEGPSHQAPHISPLPAWDGEALAGKSLVLWSDWGGLGDDIAHLRFVRAIRETRGPGRLIVAVPPALVRLAAAQSYVDQAVELVAPVTADFQCGLIESACVLGTSFDTLPTWQAYLEAPAADQDYWRTRFRGERRLKVGLVWTSTSVPRAEIPVGRYDKHLPNSALARLCGVPGVVFVSLQKGAGIPAAAGLLPGAAVIDDTADLGDMADTAALILQLDLVVSIDTSVAHLAGALGVPTLLLLKKSLAFFFPQDCSETPWYPSVRMAVQEQVRDWEPVLERARVTIARRAAGIPWPACFDGG